MILSTNDTGYPQLETVEQPHPDELGEGLFNEMFRDAAVTPDDDYASGREELAQVYGEELGEPVYMRQGNPADRLGDKPVDEGEWGPGGGYWGDESEWERTCTVIAAHATEIADDWE